MYMCTSRLETNRKNMLYHNVGCTALGKYMTRSKESIKTLKESMSDLESIVRRCVSIFLIFFKYRIIITYNSDGGFVDYLGRPRCVVKCGGHLHAAWQRRVHGRKQYVSTSEYRNCRASSRYLEVHVTFKNQISILFFFFSSSFLIVSPHFTVGLIIALTVGSSSEARMLAKHCAMP